MSIIRFCKGEKQKYCNYIQNRKYDRSYTVALQKTYDAIYEVLIQTPIFPKVLNDLINEYMTDIMIFDITVGINHETMGLGVCISTKDVHIDNRQYIFKMDYCVYDINELNSEYDQDDDYIDAGHCLITLHNESTNIFYKDAGAIDYIPFLNYYMKTLYNKSNYVCKVNQEEFSNKYKFVKRNKIKCYLSDNCRTHVKIKNHKMLKNTICMLKLIINIDYKTLILSH